MILYFCTTLPCTGISNATFHRQLYHTSTPHETCNEALSAMNNALNNPWQTSTHTQRPHNINNHNLITLITTTRWQQIDRIASCISTITITKVIVVQLVCTLAGEDSDEDYKSVNKNKNLDSALSTTQNDFTTVQWCTHCHAHVMKGRGAASNGRHNNFKWIWVSLSLLTKVKSWRHSMNDFQI